MRDRPCSICCDTTRNALASVVHLAKKVRMTNPSLDSALLDASLARLDKLLTCCAEQSRDFNEEYSQ